MSNSDLNTVLTNNLDLYVKNRFPDFNYEIL